MPLIIDTGQINILLVKSSFTLKLQENATIIITHSLDKRCVRNPTSY